MRLSLRKGAYAVLSGGAWQEIRVRSGRDDNSFVTLTSPIINLRDVHSSRKSTPASQGAPNEQNDFSVSIRYWEGETADSSASPDFLLNLVALANFMRLSLLKGAHARCPVLRGRKSGFARNDKGEGGALLEFGGPSNYPRDVVHFSLYLPQASQLLLTPRVEG